MPAGLYARYSTDKQSEASTADQMRIARAWCERAGVDVAAEYIDEGISGSTPVAARAGGKALLADALAGRIDVLVLEGLDRLSRDSVEAERIVRRLEHRGIRIVGVADGYDSQMQGRKVMRGVRGLINEIYLDDLRHKTHRGLSGRVDRGLHAGGLSYGYRSVPADGGHRLQIDEAQADVVRRIYRMFAEGLSVKRIAAALNSEGIPGPRGTWCASALFGSPAKGSGILNNRVYIGELVWNRSQWLKEPDTGKRVRIDRPEAEWQRAQHPELQIVDLPLWHAARARMDASREAGGSKGKGGRPRTLFGGLLRCPECGGAIVAVNLHKYGCTAHRDRGRAVCGNNALVRRQAVDDRLMSIVRDEIASPAALAEAERTITTWLRDRAKIQRATRENGTRRLAELEREIERLVDAIAAVGVSPALAERLRAAERERKAIQAAGAAEQVDGGLARDETVLALMRGYREKLLNLREALGSDVERARPLIAELIGPIRLTRDADGAVWAEPVREEMQTAQRLVGNAPFLGVVAGARYSTEKRWRLY